MNERMLSQALKQRESGLYLQVRSTLDALGSSGQFRSLTDLADFVARQLTYVRCRPCSRTTLLKSRAYKRLFLSFLASGASNELDVISEPPAAKSSLPPADG